MWIDDNVWIGKHVFERIKIEIYDPEGDESYNFDLPPDIYEKLKKAIKQFERKKKNGNK